MGSKAFACTQRRPTRISQCWHSALQISLCERRADDLLVVLRKKDSDPKLSVVRFCAISLKSARSYFLCGFLKWWPRDAKGAPSVSFRGFFILLYRGHLCLEGGSLLGLLSSPRMGLS